MVNGLEFTPASRTPDPRRLIEVYNASAATLNLVRAFVTGRFRRPAHRPLLELDLRAQLERRGPVRGAGRRDRPGAGVHGRVRRERRRAAHHRLLRRHEALLLEYEHALTRIDSRTGLPYDVAGHMVWIGEWTRDVRGAHVESLAPPCATRSASRSAPRRRPRTPWRWPRPSTPTTSPDASRSSRGWAPRKVRDALPPIIEAVEATGRKVVWSATRCTATPSPRATGTRRAFPQVVEEVNGFFDVTRNWAPGRAASTSSRRAPTSPSAWAGPTNLVEADLRTATRRFATRG